MNEIPEDIMEAAKSVADEAHDDMSHRGTVAAVSKAILAERERCAKIAENATIEVSMHWDPETVVTQAVAHRDRIAAAIRQGQAKEGERA